MEVRVFENNEFGSVRTAEINGKPYFCASDVAKALGYSNVSDAVNRHCRCIVKHDIPHPQAKDKEIEMSFIPEGDMYRLIVHSKLESAQKFESWVFDEVLPTIRAKGAYSLPTANTELEVLANYKAANDAFVKLLETKVEELKKINQENKPKVVVYDNLVERAKTMNFRDMAAKLRMTQTEFMNILKSKYIYKNSVGEYRAYAEFTDYFTTRTYNKGVDKTGEQLLLSMAGINYFLNKYGCCDLTEEEIQNYRTLLTDKSYVAGAIENIASKMVEA